MNSYDQGIRVYHDDLLYEPSLVQLCRIVDETGAVIVVSSSWRQITVAYQHLKEWLAKFGMEVYDKTPYAGGVRGDDITAWFNRNPGMTVCLKWIREGFREWPTRKANGDRTKGRIGRVIRP